MPTSPSLFAWFISGVLAMLAIAMHWLGTEMPMAPTLTAAGSPLEVLFAAYVVLWLSAIIRSVQ